MKSKSEREKTVFWQRFPMKNLLSGKNSLFPSLLFSFLDDLTAAEPFARRLFSGPD